MKTSEKRKPFKKIALVLSICAIIVWAMLGTGVSLAWFADTSSEINNIFQFSTFKLTVSHRVGNDWERVTGETKIFDENALFEPGYVQVQYLKVINDGSAPFRLYTAVNVNDCTPSENVYGDFLELQKYLNSGIAIFTSYDEMVGALADREYARSIASEKLHSYLSDTVDLQSGESAYVAIVVSMPEEVDNSANYRGDTIPTVELGITVKADQIVD